MKNKNIIIFSSLEWATQRQVVHEFTEFLSKDNKVIFVENTGVRSLKIKDSHRISLAISNFFKEKKLFYKINSNLVIFRPIFIPFLSYSSIIIFLNQIIISYFLKSWVKYNNISDLECFCFLPTPLNFKIMKNLNLKSLYYYCIDDMSYFSSNKKKFLEFENKITSHAKLCICTSKTLYEKIKQKAREAIYVPSGVNFDKIQRSINNIEIKDKIIFDKLKGPIFGFVGSVRNIIDYNFIKFLINSLNNECNIVFVGPIIDNPPDEIVNNKNIYFIGSKKHDYISAFINKFDYCLIPYRKISFTDAIYPTKINEYLALGKPILSTPINEIIDFNKKNQNIIKIIKSYDEPINIKSLQLETNSKEKKELALSISRQNTWENRFEVIKKKIDELDYLDKKKKWEFKFKNQPVLPVYLLIAVLILSTFIYLHNPVNKLQSYLFGKSVINLPSKNFLILSGYGNLDYYNLTYQYRVLDIKSILSNTQPENIIIFGRSLHVNENEIIKSQIEKDFKVNKIYLVNDKGKNTRDNINYINSFLMEKNINDDDIVKKSKARKIRLYCDN